MSDSSGIAVTSGLPSGESALLAGPCVAYADIEDIPEDCPCRTVGSGSEDPSDERLEELIGQASTLLWAALGRPSFGACERTIHPCRKFSSTRSSRTRSGALYGPCSCCGSDAVWLPGPVGDVISVIVDGIELDSSEYELHDGFMLVRVDGSWPAGGGPASEERFVVTYERGGPVPTLVRDATIELVNTLWVARCENRDTRLSRAVSSVNTPGVSMSFQRSEPGQAVRQYGSELPLCQAAMAAFNPIGQDSPPSVWSPDIPYENRTIRTFGP